MPPMRVLSTLPGLAMSWLGNPTRRRLLYGGAVLVLAVLSVVPQQHLARVKILPQQGNSGVSALIGALGGGAQNFAALLSGQQTNYLVIGRSHDVLRDVIGRLHLVGRPGFRNEGQAELKLNRMVDIQILTGGVLEITAKDTDPAFAEELVSGFAAAIGDRLTTLGHQQIARKKTTILAKLGEANARLNDAEGSLSRFRAANNLASPQVEFGAAVSRKLSLQAQIDSKLVELRAAQQFATGDSMRVKTILSEIAALRSQVASAEAATNSQGVERLAQRTTEYLTIYRDVQFYQYLIDVYKRFYEEVTVEEMSADTNLQIVEEAHIAPGRQFNIPALGALLLVLLLAFYTEYYVPMTGLAQKLRRGSKDQLSNAD